MRSQTVAQLLATLGITKSHFVIVVPAETKELCISASFAQKPGRGVALPGGDTARFAITLGRNVYRHRSTVLIHELGHMLGLPDLYELGAKNVTAAVGPWDLMCDAQRGTSFCGWHRHKLEWLSADRRRISRRVS